MSLPLFQRRLDQIPKALGKMPISWILAPAINSRIIYICTYMIYIYIFIYIYDIDI